MSQSDYPLRMKVPLLLCVCLSYTQGAINYNILFGQTFLITASTGSGELRWFICVQFPETDLFVCGLILYWTQPGVIHVVHGVAMLNFPL